MGGTALILEVEKLTKTFGGLQAIYEVDFTVSKGEIVSIIGPNGAGKTTLINLITGFLKPDSGLIKLAKKDITSNQVEETVRLGIARTFQLVKPFPNLKALDNVMVARLYGAEPARNVREARSEAEELLHFIGLPDRKNTIACKLTLAERRKLELARALATKPRLILLDEVIAGLTPVETELAMETIKKVHGLDITIVFVEHVMKAVMELSTKVIVLNYGRKIAEGLPQHVVKDPLVIESYLGGQI